jgi:predicted dehydrogenase
VTARDKPVGLAIVGAGYWGPNLVRNALRSPAVDLRIVCDLDVSLAQAAVGRQSTVAVGSDLQQVLDDPAVEGVAIATPASTHADLAIACLEAGKHVLIEKPLAASVAEAEKLLAVARDNGLQVMCDHTYCYTPAVMKLRQLIHAGEIGDILYFDSVRINLGLVQRDINVFWDLAPHDLSILDFILPDGYSPIAVSAHGADPMHVGQACVGYLTLPLTRGAIAHAHVNWLSPTKIRTTIVGGSRRTIVWDDLHPTQRLSLYDRGVEVNDPGENDARRERLVAYRIGDMVAPALKEGEALAGVMAEFAGSIRENRAPLTDGDAGRRILQILEAASASTAAYGATVPLAT